MWVCQRVDVANKRAVSNNRSVTFPQHFRFAISEQNGMNKKNTLLAEICGDFVRCLAVLHCD
jgi:hypothetical protein